MILERGKLHVPDEFFDALPEGLTALYDGLGHKGSLDRVAPGG